MTILFGHIRPSASWGVLAADSLWTYLDRQGGYQKGGYLSKLITHPYLPIAFTAQGVGDAVEEGGYPFGQLQTWLNEEKEALSAEALLSKYSPKLEEGFLKAVKSEEYRGQEYGKEEQIATQIVAISYASTNPSSVLEEGMTAATLTIYRKEKPLKPFTSFFTGRRLFPKSAERFNSVTTVNSSEEALRAVVDTYKESLREQGGNPAFGGPLELACVGPDGVRRYNVEVDPYTLDLF